MKREKNTSLPLNVSLLFLLGLSSISLRGMESDTISPKKWVVKKVMVAKEKSKKEKAQHELFFRDDSQHDLKITLQGPELQDYDFIMNPSVVEITPGPEDYSYVLGVNNVVKINTRGKVSNVTACLQDGSGKTWNIDLTDRKKKSPLLIIFRKQNGKNYAVMSRQGSIFEESVERKFKFIYQVTNLSEKSNK